jgi:hypothetical protein
MNNKKRKSDIQGLKNKSKNADFITKILENFKKFFKNINYNNKKENNRNHKNSLYEQNIEKFLDESNNPYKAKLNKILDILKNKLSKISNNQIKNESTSINLSNSTNNLVNQERRLK